MRAYRHCVIAAAASSLLVFWSANAAEPDPDTLDNAETNICAAQARLRAAMAGALEARAAPVPVEQLSGQKIADPGRRALLQQQLDSSIANAQEGLVNDARRDLLRYQSEYKSLTGTEFNAALCSGTLPRTTH